MLFLSSWPLRRKLIAGSTLLAIIVLMLAYSGFRGVYAYRNLVRSLRDRAAELPLAGDLAQHVSELRITASRIRRVQELPLGSTQDTFESQLRRQEFSGYLLQTRTTLQQYRDQLTRDGDMDTLIDDKHREWTTVRKIELSLERIAKLNANEAWMFDEVRLITLNEELDDLHQFAKELPSHLHSRLRDFAGEVRTEYRALIFTAWISAVNAVVLFGILGLFFSKQIFQPLRRLIHDARWIEKHRDFNHRIVVSTHDEIAELAAAMNAMTDRFQEINNNLEAKVAERTRALEETTKELIQSEQLASVGFLAAGVAHEINNPLQAIAGFSEALNMRLADVPENAEDTADLDLPFMRRSLARIHDEAFRCKNITDKLLDYSRMGKAEKHETDLRLLTLDMIEMVRAVGKSKDKSIVFDAPDPVVAPVNAQELKQVVLNLLTNALESLDPGGYVHVELRRDDHAAELIVTDNGCGMSPDVLQHLFKPFFTKRREGAGPGTGLGLSIVHRIVEDHHGAIQAFSEGPGKGSRMRLTLPLKSHEEQRENRSKQAA